MSWIERKEGEIMAALVFRRSQLLYDIENCCYIEGDVVGREAYEIGKLLKDVGQEGNVDRMTRILDLSAAECSEALYPFTKREVRNRVKEDRLEEKEEYVIMIKIPESFSQTSLDFLEELVHEYIVDQCVGEWLRIVRPEKWESWKRKAEEIKDRIKEALSVRRGKVRRRISPF